MHNMHYVDWKFILTESIKLKIVFVYTEWVNKNFTLKCLNLLHCEVFGLIIFYEGEITSWPLTAVKSLTCDFISKWRPCLWTCSKCICINSMENNCHKMWPKVPKTFFFFSFHSTNAELSLKTNLMINLATLDKLLIFVNLVCIFMTFLIM